MKATNLYHISSSPAPVDWARIPHIQENKPNRRGLEISLQKLDGLDICIWMIKSGAVWTPASDFYHVEI